MEIVNKHGGLTRCARLLTKELGIEVTKWNLANWIYRKKVPLLYIKRIAKVLGVSPYALNYREYSDFNDSDKPWKQIVKSVAFIPVEKKREIYRLKHPE